MRIARLLVAAVVTMGSTLVFAENAHANQLDACGDFFFDPVGDIECEVEFEGGCEVHCEPIAFEIQCAAELYVGCEGGCDVDVDVGCTADCEAGCTGGCDAGEFDCQAYCEGGCRADCDSYCETDGNSSECAASCEATCSGECGASCTVEAPECDVQCQASCEGECHAEANIDCQIECQADGYIDCQTRLSGGCEAACKSPKGAIFCDGQWVNTDDLDACVDAIQSFFDIEVTGYADAECEGNTCTAEAGCTASCATVPTNSPDFSIGLFGAAGAAIAFAGVRRARRNKRNED